jgi:hypothetical protein
LSKPKQSEAERREKRRIQQQKRRAKKPSRKKDKQRKSPMEKLIGAYLGNRSLRLTADEVQNLINRDGGLSNIVEMFDPNSNDHEEFMRYGLSIMRGEGQPLENAAADVHFSSAPSNKGTVSK